MNCRTLIIVALLLLGTTALSFGQAGKYKISGKITGLPDGTVLELIPITHDEEKPENKTIVKDGAFIFTGSLPEPSFYFMRVTGEPYTGLSLMVENSSILVTAIAKPSENEGRKGHTISDIKIAGSKSHDLYLEKSETRRRQDLLYQKYHADNTVINARIDSARKVKDTALVTALMQTAAYKKFEADEKRFFDTVEVQINNLILSNKNSWWGAFLMIDQFSYLTPEQKKLYEQLSPAAKQSYYGKKVHAELYPKSYVGLPAPSLALVDESNRPVSFSSVAKNKRYVIIDFWASWCGPCRRAIPGLKAFYEEMKGKGVEIVSVSIDKDAQAWAKANKEEALPWISVLDKKAVSKAFGVKAIPAMFLLDAKGKVLAENLTMEDLKSKIQ
ncbi:TlpA disulfide reductase family protein [Chitinophaga sp.]|uniref:TlpA disulfide reductase family protein n=1 Tax=Chitinophaga sp. TaxID=1869181 RepID=UPI002BF1FCBF|nr:TlpA disulfide reductase family protein [Chitinophaga sp.]HWV68898.1 TlpA disulfide reductase family protein [Chitinophaga sp.]